MNYLHLMILSGGLFLLCSCTFFYGAQAAPAPVMQSPRPLAVPVGKNWQVIEEAPKLSDNQGRLPFQTEQSLQPEGLAKPARPVEDRTIELPR